MPGSGREPLKTHPSARLTRELVEELRDRLRAGRLHEGAAHNELDALERWVRERAPGLTSRCAAAAAYGISWADVPGALERPRRWRLASGLPPRAGNRGPRRYAPRPDLRKLAPDAARRARAMLGAGASVAAVAREIGVARSTVRALRDGVTYRSATERDGAGATPLERALRAAPLSGPRGSRSLAIAAARDLRARAAEVVAGLRDEGAPDEERLARECLAVRLDLRARRVLA